MSRFARLSSLIACAGASVLTFCLALPNLTAAATTPASPPPATAFALQTPAPTGRIVVKLRPQAGLFVDAGGLRERVADKAVVEGRVRLEGLLARVAPGAVWARRFTASAPAIDELRAAAAGRLAAASGRPQDAAALAADLPDLNLWAELTPPGAAGDRDALLSVVKALLADPAVETAFLEPVAVPAALGFDAFTGRFDPAAARAAALAAPPPTGVPAPAGVKTATSSTPDYSGLQDYLGAPPAGLGALAVAAQPGARGPGVTVIDVEGAWLWTHEDLTAPAVTLGSPVPSLSWRNHGTAVMGEIRGTDNGFGVRGIAPDLAIGGASINDFSVADAITQATAHLAAGNIILIELHAPGPASTGVGQFGYLPMEFWTDNFDAIRLATAAGVIVVEAAGNGEQDLDDPLYAGLFDRNVRDSGAIMVGAGYASSNWAAWFSNAGTRVDLHGFGLNVTTTAYGDLQGDPLPETTWYTSAFNGTSSASPMVVGAVAALQGMVKAAYGFPLNAALARSLFVSTGVAPLGTRWIGPLPNLPAAWAAAAGGIGRVAGIVTEAGTAAPLPGLEVEVQPTTAFTLTNASGGYGMPLAAGAYALTFADFFHAPLTLPATVTGGGVALLSPALFRLPAVTITGEVHGLLGAPLAGARVTPLAVPLPAVVTGANGVYAVTGAPSGHVYTLLYDDHPGYGATVRTVTVPSGASGRLPVYADLPPVTIDFNATDAGFTPLTPLWSWDLPARGVGPAGGFDGGKCWGVGMHADYPDTQWSTLASPRFDFAAVPQLLLSFHYWSQTEPGFDGVKLEATRDSVWANVTPLTGYTDQTLGGLFSRPGWSGHSNGWRGVVFDLTAFRSPTFRFRLCFGSDQGVTDAGFWVDGIAFAFGAATTGVGDDNAPPRPAGPSLAVQPNPFNPSTAVSWRGASPGDLRIVVYDLRGRPVRTLWDGPAAAAGTLRWDGRDDRGAAVGSGVYLVRLRDARGDRATARALLVR